MVVPIVAAAAARVAATSAARAAASGAARAGAQATVRAGTQTVTQSAATGTRASTAATREGTLLNQTNTPRVGGTTRNTAMERNTLQLGERPTESRATGERGTAQQTAPEQIQQESRTRDRRIQRTTQQDESEGEEASEKKKRMSFITLMSMLVVAFIFDALQTLTALMVFGIITAAISYLIAFISNILAWSIFIIWFGLLGINIFGGRKVVVAVVGFVADTAFAGIIPYWTVTVLVAYFDEKLEEKGIGLSKVVSLLK